MFYVLIENDRAVSVTTECPHKIGAYDARYQNRNDWKTMARAEEVAAQLTEATGQLFIATDASASTSPRYDVIEAPKVGEKVSRYFNGDSYPAGEIVKISASLKRVETSDGTVFFRRRQSGSWINNGTWGMEHGHNPRLNPSF
jgi:hypothetical protein